MLWIWHQMQQIQQFQAELFDPRPYAVADGSLFEPDEIAALFAIADQASDADRDAAREMRKDQA